MPYNGIHFSPDGKYYLNLHTGEWNHVYETATNFDLTVEVRSAIPSIAYSWIPDRGHHLLSSRTIYLQDSDSVGQIDSAKLLDATRMGSKEERFYIYDVDKRQIVEEWIEKP